MINLNQARFSVKQALLRRIKLRNNKNCFVKFKLLRENKYKEDRVHHGIQGIAYMRIKIMQLSLYVWKFCEILESTAVVNKRYFLPLNFYSYLYV